MAGFIQIIEMQTSRIDEVEALIGELRNRLDDGGCSASRRGTMTLTGTGTGSTSASSRPEGLIVDPSPGSRSLPAAYGRA